MDHFLGKDIHFNYQIAKPVVVVIGDGYFGTKIVRVIDYGLSIYRLPINDVND